MSSLWPCLLLLITLYLVVLNKCWYEAAKGKICQSIPVPNAFARFTIVDQYDQYYEKPETRNSSHWACSVRHDKSLVWLAYNCKSLMLCGNCHFHTGCKNASAYLTSHSQKGCGNASCISTSHKGCGNAWFLIEYPNTNCLISEEDYLNIGKSLSVIGEDFWLPIFWTLKLFPNFADTLPTFTELITDIQSIGFSSNPM